MLKISPNILKTCWKKAPTCTQWAATTALPQPVPERSCPLDRITCWRIEKSIIYWIHFTCDDGRTTAAAGLVVSLPPLYFIFLFFTLFYSCLAVCVCVCAFAVFAIFIFYQDFSFRSLVLCRCVTFNLCQALSLAGGGRCAREPLATCNGISFVFPSSLGGIISTPFCFFN